LLFAQALIASQLPREGCAAGFRSSGISAGQRVLLQLPNSCRFAITLFGLLRTGAIPVMCLPGHRSAELSHFAEVSRAVALVIIDTAGGFDYRAMADELARTHPMRIITELPTESGTDAPSPRRTLRRRRCCWCPKERRARRNSFPARMTTMSIT
jgi:non-ribosomal peptide synthetase component E (peptide arylation enzyme)